MSTSTGGVEVRPSRIGLGLFATERFVAGDTILRIDGRLVNWRELLKRRGSFMDNCYRFGPETYLDPGDRPARYVNHSCVPNAAVHKARNRLYLVAVAAISAGREITFDYSTTIADDDIWTMRCRCGSPQCRRIIRNFGSLPQGLRKKYVNRGMVPGFILRVFV
ncbi:MAG TPA: SET domain-containing protein-lysine N-methyltransferase [Gemmatimonadaceae bacterium]|nr:SET domain-containing protein-lysine N-methyltransferase [Gemmatimonadaceae bacterium]